jgi:hypothetical protein
LENLKGREHSVDTRVDDEKITSNLREIQWEGMDWIHLAKDGDLWWALLNIIEGGEFLDQPSDY